MTLRNKDFVNLHVHDEFSLLDGAVKTKELCKGAAEGGYKYLASSNHGSMDGIVKFNKACSENGIKPVFGCELYLMEHWDKRKEKGNKNLHLIAHAKNERGLKKLLVGLGYANIEGWGKSGWAGRPFLPMDYPLKNKWAGDVVIQTGCGSSPFWNAENGIDLLGQYYEAFKDDLYAEIMPLDDLDWQKNINEKAIIASQELNIKTVATNDIHFLCEKDHRVHDVVLGIGQRGMTWNNPKRWKFDTHLNYLRPAKDMYLSLRKMGVDKRTARASILNTMEVAEKCSFELKKIPVDLPRVLEPGINETVYLIDECRRQLEKRGLVKNVYIKRLERELEAIISGDFVRYMLLVADVINWAKRNDILVGHGRGSSGGSLVSYLLRITEVDPIEHGLIFERFISEGRVDLPDIDIDFEDRKRHLIEKYLKEKYGEWNVAHVSTFGVMRGKQAIADVSRLFEVPRQEALAMSKCIIVRPEMDARASFGIMDTVEIFEEAKRFAKKYPHVIRYASKLEGQVKTCGIHAAGYVVSKVDLRTAGNCYLVNRSKGICVNWDKEDLEQMGLMKLDVLGLSTLSVMSEAKRLIREKYGKNIDYYKINLHKPYVYEEIAKGNTVCSFQIGSKGLQKFCRDLEVSDFRTLVDASALWRPGCLKAGITAKYLEIKLGREEVEYFNDIHKGITESTCGQIIYQEQIMFLLYNMAGIPWKTTDQVRKVISKSEGTDKWKTYKRMYAKGCVKKGTMKYDEAEEFFDKLKFFGIYAFNLSHAVEYGILSYITQWLKIRYPLQFFTAYLNYGSVGGEDAGSAEDKIDIALKEAKRMGIKAIPPDINKSGSMWTVAE